jgi:sugar/nucleoside kinase (ribokinase family)
LYTEKYTFSKGEKLIGLSCQAASRITVSTVAVKLGARGAAARRGSQMVYAASTPVACFVYAYLVGQDLPQALRFACACGALSTHAEGGTAAQAAVAEALATWQAN